MSVARTVEHLTRLWTEPVPASAEAVRAFGELYTDPVSINGTPTSLLDLVERARALQRAFADLSMEIVDEFEAPNRLVIVFLQRDHRISAVQVVPDNLGLAMQLDAVAFRRAG